MNPKFSIIIPVYNVAPYLRECLDSVLAQTFSDWEVICVDDGSTDGSGAILDDYTLRDARFRVVRQPRTGVSVARNSALEIVRGDWIGFLDGDDRIEASWLSDIAEVICASDFDLIRAQFKYWRPGTAREYGGGFPAASERLVGREAVIRWGWSILVERGFACLLFVRRECVGNIRFPVGMAMKEDVIFGLNVIRNCRSVCQCSVSGYLYRVRQTSACNVKRKYSDCYRFVSEVSALWKRTVESEEGILGDEKVRAAVSRSLWDDFAQWARSRDCKLDDKEKIGKLKMLMCGLLRADVIALTPDRVPWVLSKFALKYLNAIWPVFAFVWLMRFKTAVVRCVVGCCRGGSAV